MFKRPNELSGITYECQSGCCKLYVTINYDDEGVKEVFVNTAGTGCTASINGLGRAISLGLQNGLNPSEYLRTLSKAVCPACVKNRESEGRSCPEIIAKLIIETQEKITHG